MQNLKLILPIFLLSLSGCFKTAQELEKSKKESPQHDDSKYIQNASLGADIENIKIEMQKIHGSNNEMQLKLEEMHKTNEALKQRLSTLEENNQKFQDSTTKTLADVVGDIALLDERTAKPEKSKKPEAPKKKSNGPESAITGELPTKQLAGQSPIDEAMGLMKAKKYSQATAILDEALKGKSNFRDVLLYFHGESLFKAGDYKKAIVSYDEVVQKYKESDKWTKAVERVAQSFEKLSMKDEATAYRTLLKEHKKSKKR